MKNDSTTHIACVENVEDANKLEKTEKISVSTKGATSNDEAGAQTEKELFTSEEREKTAEENIALVYYAVQAFQGNSNVDHDELVSVAMVGFAKAINAYDKSRNVKFSTFAMNCMRNEIFFHLRNEKKHTKNDVSLSAILSTDKNGNVLSLGDVIIADESDPTLEEAVLIFEDLDLLDEGIEGLTPNEKYIATYRFGLDRGIVKTQKEIADVIGMSQANVSKLEQGIICKLRTHFQKNKAFVGY